MLTDILRDEWGFQGFVVSDYTSINELVPHGYANDENHAAELSFNAGLDMDMQGAAFITHLVTLAEEHKVNVEQIDRATRSILEAKYKLGLFDDPLGYSDEDRERATIYRTDILALAQEAARKSFVLLKNDNQTLPLRKDDIRIALIGPLGHSKEDMIGSWAGAGDREDRPATILEGLQAAADESTAIEHVRGASYEFNADDSSDFEQALRLAKTADVVVLAMGEKWNMTGEAASRTSLKIPGNQPELMAELRQLGKPMVLLLLNGRPLSLTWEDENIDAILEVWYPGTMGGHAIAGVLFGDYSPSGKLPVTFPRNVGQVPIHYNVRNTGRPVDPQEPKKYVSQYLNTSNTPLYPFGYGLSYTRFEYGEIGLSANEMSMSGEIHGEIEVRNIGPVDGDEIVQMYIRDMVGSTTRPVKELKGFQKIHLPRGESKTVSFTIAASDLAFYQGNGSYGVEAGEFRVFVGGNSVAVKAADFELLKSARTRENNK